MAAYLPGRLRKFLGERIVVEVESTYNTFHGDDTDRGDPRISKYTGTLLAVSEAGIMLSCSVEFIPFYNVSKTEHSETITEIISISLENPVIYRSGT